MRPICLQRFIIVRSKLIGRAYRFDNPFLPGAAFLPGFAEQLDVLGEDEGAGEEVEFLLPKASLHLGQVPPQPVLPANLKGSWEVVQLRKDEQKNKTKQKTSLI